jgi:TetR/AcrR family transcriptional regulator, mexCD-oprJ operon repressor
MPEQLAPNPGPTPHQRDTPHPREAVAERNLEAILDAAERLMARGEAPSVSAVATEAGVSRPTVYAHFPQREQLVEAVVERTVSRVTTAITSAEPDQGAPLEALRRLLGAGWVELGRHRAIGHAAARELSAEAMHRSHHAALLMLHQLLERGRADGSFRTDLPPELLVMAALALIHTTADATRQGVLDARVAGAAAEQLVVEMWRRD